MDWDKSFQDRHPKRARGGFWVEVAAWCIVMVTYAVIVLLVLYVVDVFG